MALVQRRSAADTTARSPRFQAPADDDDNLPAEEDERPTRRRAARDDDEDDAPRGEAVKSGWAAARKLKSEGGDFAQEFKFDRDPVLVKFIGDAPFAVYKQHWVEGLRSTGKKSFICLGKGCPLCTVGESASKKWAFNVALIDPDEPEMKALIAGSRLFDDIADEHDKNGGIDQGYYALSKSGKKQSTTYKVNLVKERDLQEDWGISPDDAEDCLVGLVPYTSEQYKAPSRSYLQEIADELTGGDD